MPETQPDAASTEHNHVDRIEAFAAAWPTTTDMIIALRPLEPSGPRIALHHSDLAAHLAERRDLLAKLAAITADNLRLRDVLTHVDEGAYDAPSEFALTEIRHALAAIACADASPDAEQLCARIERHQGPHAHRHQRWIGSPRAVARLDAPAATSGRDDDPGEVASCRVCGCSDQKPCEASCLRVPVESLGANLCTACAWAIARDAVKSGLYSPRPFRLPTGPDTTVLVDLAAKPSHYVWLEPQPELGDVEQLRAELGRQRRRAARLTQTLEDVATAIGGDKLSIEWSWHLAGATFNVATEAEVRRYIADMDKLYPEGHTYRVRRRFVGAWVDEEPADQAKDEADEAEACLADYEAGDDDPGLHP